jgi:NAD-dependent deacetylase
MTEPPLPSGLIETVRAAERLVVLSGAGTSAESGVPTFRDAQTGLWARYDPLELATPGAFAADPGLVWDWYAWRRELVAAARPNAGHVALARLAALKPGTILVTQNVDGLHQRAGSDDVIEFHGSLLRDRCVDCDRRLPHDPSREGRPPRCPACGGLLRPDVVWFGEAIPPVALARAFEAAGRAEVFFSIGTSSLVTPAADLAEQALRAGAVVVEINPAPTPLASMAEFALAEPAGTSLPRLVAALEHPVA